MSEREKNRDELESWERWPVWAIGLSNGLNIALWYILSMARIRADELSLSVPAFVAGIVPLLIVAGGVAAALSLDGALIAAIAGARLGRRGPWTWLTIIGSGLFSAAIAYTVHSGSMDQTPMLHIAQACVLVLYNLHLMQPRQTPEERKAFTGWFVGLSNRQQSDRALPALRVPSLTDTPRKALESGETGFSCQWCGGSHPTANDVKRCKAVNAESPTDMG